MKTFFNEQNEFYSWSIARYSEKQKKTSRSSGISSINPGVPYLVVKNSLVCGDARHIIFCGYYTHGKNKEFCVILNACLKSLREVHKS